MKLATDTYKYPSSTRAPIDGLRHYTIEGKSRPLPSVTTILSRTQSEDKKEGLRRWREKVGEAEAKRNYVNPRTAVRRCTITWSN